jgi:hypothetical protein
LFYLCQAQEEHAHLILFRDTVECAKARAQPRWAEVGGRGGRGGRPHPDVDPERRPGEANWSGGTVCLGTQLEDGLGRLRNMWDCLRCDCIRRIIATNHDGNTEQESWSQDTPGHRAHPEWFGACCKPTTQCSTRLCNECGEPVMSWSIKNTEHKGTRDSLFTYPHLRMGETH